MRQNMYCHNCSQNFSIDIDMSLNGNHVFRCPHCNHEHCRVVKDGVVTGERWDSRNINTYYVNSYSTSCALTSDIYLTDSWLSTSTSTTYW